MPRKHYDPDSIEFQLKELEHLDEEDASLLHYVFYDDRPPQGLHRGGWEGEWLRDEEDWVDEYLYPRGDQ